MEDRRSNRLVRWLIDWLTDWLIGGFSDAIEDAQLLPDCVCLVLALITTLLSAVDQTPHHAPHPSAKHCQNLRSHDPAFVVLLRSNAGVTKYNRPPNTGRTVHGTTARFQSSDVLLTSAPDTYLVASIRVRIKGHQADFPVELFYQIKCTLFRKYTSSRHIVYYKVNGHFFAVALLCPLCFIFCTQ